MASYSTLSERGILTIYNTPGSMVGKDIRRRGRNVARAAKRIVGKRSGALRTSIHVTPYTMAIPPKLGRDPVSSRMVQVGSDLPYALVHHEGSRPHVIEPAKAELLVFPGGKGGLVFTDEVHHPGTRGTKYLTKALPAAYDD